MTSKNRARVQLLLEIAGDLLVINPWRACFEVDLQEREVERLNKSGGMTKHKIMGEKTMKLELELRKESFWSHLGKEFTMEDLTEFFMTGQRRFDLIYSPLEAPGSLLMSGCLVTNLDVAHFGGKDLTEENRILTVSLVIDEVQR